MRRRSSWILSLAFIAAALWTQTASAEPTYGFLSLERAPVAPKGDQSAGDRGRNEVFVYVSPTGDDARDGGTAATAVATLQRALELASGGQTILLATGSYPEAADDTARDMPVLVRGYDGPVRVDGLSLRGAQNIIFNGITFTESVRMSMHAKLGLQQPARDILFLKSDISSVKGSHCVVLRDGVQRVAFLGNTVHDCRMGFAGAGGATPSSDISITGNTIRNVFSDGIQFGDWSNVTIAGNVIRDIRDPAGVIHNDAIQLTGDSRNVLIAGNLLDGSDGQLIIMQANVGPVNDVRIVNNVLTNSEAIPIQSFGVSGLSVVHNTIWFGNGHGILIRSIAGVAGTDVEVVNNIATAIETYAEGKITRSSGNVTYCPRGRPPTLPPGVVTCLTGAPDFVSPTQLDFRLSPSSPLRNLVPTATPSDLAGLARGAMTSPGAYG